MTSNKQTTFLEETIDQLIAAYPDKLSQLCIVTPNRRTQVFIKHYFIEKQQAFLLPKLLSIDDFVQHLSPYVVFDAVDLSFELYAVYKFLEGEEAQTFERFLQWAPVLINDFNEIDLHLADGNALFSYLSDAYAIKEWNLGEDELTEFQKNYLAFFHKLNDYYQYFTQSLKAQNAAYSGLAYRFVAENIDALIEKQSWHKIVFAGFNALSLSEERIIRQLYQSKKADLFWDIDSYYFDDKNQEAGLFFRTYSDWFPFDKTVLKNHFRQAKEITLIAVPRAIGQAKIAAELLSRNRGNSNTALVLADESLLMPVLNSLSAEVLQQTNVTMGYPLKNTSTHLLFRLFFKLQGNAQRYAKNQRSLHFLRDDLLQILINPLVVHFFGKYSAIEKALKKQIFWKEEELKALFETVQASALGFLFVALNDTAEQTILFFQNFIREFSTAYAASNKELQLQYASDWEAFSIYARLLNRLTDRIQKYGFPLKQQEFKLVFEQLIGNQNQSFRGEPLKGLQLMGLLETRVLDFENLILLSANEDILPSGKMTNSFIPVDVKRSFKLPTYKEKNAIFAYHFYRLLQRAKNIQLLYSTSSTKLAGGEKSRFLTQILLELSANNDQIQIRQQLFNFKDVDPQNLFAIVIQKDKVVQDRLTALAEKGISPTVFNMYIQCPLKFYFKKILKIEEPEEEEGLIDDLMLGNIVHHTLQELFTPYLGKEIGVADLKRMKAALKAEIDVQVGKEAKGQKLDSGQNFLTIKSIEKYIHDYLSYEQKNLEENLKNGGAWNIVSLEQTLERDLQLPASKRKIKVLGVTDRIDRWNGTIRILDYKTGYVKPEDLKLAKRNELFADTKYEKAIQLLWYAFLYPGQKQEIKSGIIALRKGSDPYVYVSEDRGESVGEALLDEFEIGLYQVLEELFDPAIPIVQTNNPEKCRLCAYSQICLK